MSIAFKIPADNKRYSIKLVNSNLVTNKHESKIFIYL